MTIDTQVNKTYVVSTNEQRSFPDAHRFASCVLSNTSHYLNIAISSPHWQLKDLLVSSSYSNFNDDINNNLDPTFYFPYKNSIFSFNYSSILSSDLNSNIHTKIIKYSSIKFQSSPRCLKTLDGIVVTGGISTTYDPDTNPIGLHKGSFSIYNPINSITENIQIGEFITNSVSINKLSTSNSSHYRSYLCNNDKFLYQFDITPSRIIQTANPLYLKTALNHSILSNDGKTQIVVGDTSKIFISHPLDNNPILNSNNYDIIQTEGDCGFSTSFLPNNNLFITCFQDGLALIYDLRNLSNPIHKIYSTRPKTQPGAFRVVKTSDYNNDLICISEHQGRVHLIDTRNFNNHSVLLFPKYLYNVPPSVSVSYKNESLSDDDNDDDNNNNNNIDTTNYFDMFGKYPIAVSADNNDNDNNNNNNYTDTSKQWYNQPIIKDIDDFKDLEKFGGDLNLGYLESYRYMENRYKVNNGSDRFLNTQHTDDLNNQMNSFKIMLQGTYDRESILKKYLSKPQLSNLLIYRDSYPVQFRKRRQDNDNIEEREMYDDDDDDNDTNYDNGDNYDGSFTNSRRCINDQWWNQENNEIENFTDIWPWGKKIFYSNSSNDDNFNEYQNNNKDIIMETPYRDPFFYVDSDIEINGLELANKNGKSTLCIGTKEGIIFWDVNNWKRKSFPSFGYV